MNIRILQLVIFLSTFIIPSFSQTYKISITNGEYKNENAYEFDVIIISKKAVFELTSYQASLSFFLENPQEVNFSYISGTSELTNPPLLAVGTIVNNRNSGLLTFASFPGSDMIGDTEIIIGRFRLISSQNLIKSRLLIFWNFAGDMQTIITGPEFSNITPSGGFYPVKGNYFFHDPSDMVDYELMQNFPNPFNPTTSIKFKISFESSVKLEIFNVLGEKVKTLVDEFLTPGVYETDFNAELLPSGYYIYTLYINNKIVANKKMVLLK